MSIKAIRLRNFRGFQNASIDLKPLTVLLGPNSSGKSSFGHALSSMAHSQWLQGNSEKASLTPGRVEVAEWPVDLGTLQDLRTQGVEGERVYIDLQTDAGWVQYGFGLDPAPQPSNLLPGDLILSYVSHPGTMPGATTNATSTEIHPRQMDDEGRAAAVPTGMVAQGLIPETLTSDQVILERSNEVIWRIGKSRDEAKVGLAGLIVETVRHHPGGTAVTLRKGATDAIKSLLQDLIYLRATRERPSRSYPIGTGTRSRQSIGYSGEWTAALLNKLGSKIAEEVEYVAFQDPPRVIRDISDLKKGWETKRETLALAVANWLTYLNLADSVETQTSGEDRIEVRVKVAGKPHNLTEVGFGISQILPVLIGGLMNPPIKLFIVDLPEAHLHPGPEVKLADFFCSLALTGRTCLVETHSRLFFDRLRLRVELHPELRDKVSVYFMDQAKDGLCQPPRSVGLGYKDEDRWPTGFFHEGWDTEVQISSLRAQKNDIK